jgi:hypothetical protein
VRLISRRQRLFRVAFVAALGVMVVAAVVSTRGSVQCVLSTRPTRALDLSQPQDRELFRRALANVEQIAERYRESVRAIPAASTSKNARESLASRPDRAYRYCQAILTEQIVRTSLATGAR